MIRFLLVLTLVLPAIAATQDEFKVFFRDFVIFEAQVYFAAVDARRNVGIPGKS